MSSFNHIDYIVAAYALLLFIGGFIGFIKSGSAISIAVSSISAAFLIASLYLKTACAQMGYSITYGLIILLTALFCWRFTVSGKFMPAGLFTLISIFMLIYLFFFSKK